MNLCFDSYGAILDFAAAECGDQLVIDMQRFEQEEDEAQRIAFLETTDVLSHDFILYLIFHERDFFMKHVHPLLQDRSNSVFDLFCYHFACSCPEQEVLDEIRPKIEHLFNLFSTTAEEFNGCEIAMLLIMQSHYSDVAACLQMLASNELSDRAPILNRRLMNLKDDEPRPPKTMGFTHNRVENRVIQEFDQLYVERLWYSDGYDYDNVPFTLFWLEFAQQYIEQRQIRLEAFLEAAILDSTQTKRLACACMSVVGELEYDIDSSTNSDLKISLTTEARLSYPELNSILKLEVSLLVQSSDFAPALVSFELPDGLLSEDMESCTQYELEIVPGANQITFSHDISCFTTSAGPIKGVFEIRDEMFDIEVEVLPCPLHQLLPIPKIAAEREYAKMANKEEHLRQIHEFLFVRDFERLLLDRSFAYELLELYLETEHSNHELYSKFEFLVGFIHNDAEIIESRLQHVFCGFCDMKLEVFDEKTSYDITLNESAQLLTCDNNMSVNLIENSMSEASFQSYAGLRLKQHTCTLNVAESNELALLLFVEGRFEEAVQTVTGIDNCTAQLLSLMASLAMSKATTDDLRKFKNDNEALLNVRNNRIISDLIGETEEEPFLVSEEKGVIHFNKEPVHLKFWKRTVEGTSSNFARVMPHSEIDVEGDSYSIEQPGNFYVECQHGMEACEIEVDNISIEWTLDQDEGILSVEGANIDNKYYCQVNVNNSFYKDGFTDSRGRFDYFTVSDKSCSTDPLDITIISKSGEFVKFAAACVREVVVEDSSIRPMPISKEERKHFILPK